MDSLDLAFLPALEQANLIRSKEISPLDLVELYLDRIQTLDPTLGSYVAVAAETAIAEAKTKMAQLAEHSDDLPPFFGVPIPIKDLNPVAGLPCAYGVKVLKNRVATEDDGIVTRLRQAGFIILGKTATSEAGTLPYTEPPGFLPTRNPWNLAYTAGGSSGGAAAAVAAGLCSIAQGSDGGGSIRGPAFCCGLVGLKPSRGRVTHAPVGDRLNGIAINGPLGRTVADTAALLDVMAGYVPGDPYWLPDPEPSFLASTLVATQSRSPRLRIAVTTAVQPVGDADPICQQAVLETATRLEKMGHLVEPGCPDFGELAEPFEIVFQSSLAEAGIPDIFLGKMNRWWRWKARFSNCGDYLRAVTKMQTVSRQIVQFFDRVDLLLMPTYMHPVIQVGEWQKLRPPENFAKIVHWIAPCPPFNATGQPAIAIPTGFDPNGVPIGVQLVGRPAAESTLLAVAAELEADRPWQHHRPAFATTGIPKS